jgi:hypothetical protein
VFSQKGGFDIVIANPPYIRADNPDILAQRKAIQAEQNGSEPKYKTLWERWDLYIAFIERGYQLLRDSGVECMIVSNAYCHSKYAIKSQQFFLKNALLRRLDFLGELQIFDAGVRNMIFFYEKRNGYANTPERRVHVERFGNVLIKPSGEQQLLTHDVYFPEERRQTRLNAATVPLGEICYVSFGCRPNSNERLARGAFVAADLVSYAKDEDHPKPYIEAKDTDRWVFEQRRWLEWGTSRSPSELTRPTFAELYEVPEKIVVADISGAENRAAYDTQRVFHSHTLISIVPWDSLSGVRNKSIRKTAVYSNEKTSRKHALKREQLEATSRDFPAKFLLAILNSRVARDFLRNNRRSNIHLYPDDWKHLPIPEVSQFDQEMIVRLVDSILEAKRAGDEATVKTLETEIDNHVYRLYGLTPEEIALIENSTPRN